jgi:hypothetical protein
VQQTIFGFVLARSSDDHSLLNLEELLILIKVTHSDTAISRHPRFERAGRKRHNPREVADSAKLPD